MKLIVGMTYPRYGAGYARLVGSRFEALVFCWDASNGLAQSMGADSMSLVSTAQKKVWEGWAGLDPSERVDVLLGWIPGVSFEAPWSPGPPGAPTKRIGSVRNFHRGRPLSGPLGLWAAYHTAGKHQSEWHGVTE